MPRKSKSLDEDQIKMRKVMVDRLNELIDKAGGKKKFIDKINKIRTGGDQTDHKSLTAWLDPAKKITIYNIYQQVLSCFFQMKCSHYARDLV